MSQFEGFPEKYDPDAMAASMQQYEQGVDHRLEGLIERMPAARDQLDAGYPDYNTVRELRIDAPTVGGSYGGDNDPRVGHVQGIRGVGTTPHSHTQRFRLAPGTEVVPLLWGPENSYGDYRMEVPYGSSSYQSGFSAPWSGCLGGTSSLYPDTSSSNYGDGGIDQHKTQFRFVAFGRVILGIPHTLKRLPEFVVARCSSSPKGPTGQQVIVSNSSGALPGTNVKLRVDLDFVPVLGIEPPDIERQLKFLFGFGNGSITTSEHGYGEPGSGFAPAAYSMNLYGSQYSNTNLLSRFASEMVTTKRTFAGILLATTSGISTYRSGATHQRQTTGDDAGGTAFPAWANAIQHMIPYKYEQKVGSVKPLWDTQNNVHESMASVMLPGLPGKSLGMVPVDSAHAFASPEAMYAGGLRLMLASGSVDFVMR